MPQQEVLSEKRSVSASVMRFFEAYDWVFVVVGLFGNLMFFAGSVCFLFHETKTFGVWLFIGGSLLMLVSGSASALSEYLHRSKI